MGRSRGIYPAGSAPDKSGAYDRQGWELPDLSGSLFQAVRTRPPSDKSDGYERRTYGRT